MDSKLASEDSETLYSGADRLLGHRVAYPREYAPGALVRVARAPRPVLGATAGAVGVDVWHAYEVSALMEGGLPVAGILKMVYSADSPYIVESKSLKLYLHSLNSETLGASREAVAKGIEGVVARDLSALLESPVSVRLHFQPNARAPFQSIMPFEEHLYRQGQPLEIPLGQEDPSRWDLTELNLLHEASFASHLLRSNCPITHQPDWGSIYIHYSSKRTLNHQDLLAYLLSLRAQAHFHEQICQQIFTVLAQALEPTDLCVAALYLRRGGIDINPVRALSPAALPEPFVNADYLTEPLLRQ